MDNLQGGTLSLEHRYRLDSRHERHALVTRYYGFQLPFEGAVWVDVYDPLAEAGANPRVFERIKRSAERAHHIDGPGVARAIDYGELDKGVPFVVSDRTEGPTLAAYLAERGPLPPTDAARLGAVVARALESAHAIGLPHGTLDPHWIELEKGELTGARVGHFQVGLTLDELRRIDGAVLTPELLRPYPPETFELDTIPPEELDDEHDPTDQFSAAADIYALGCILYEAVVGFHPYFDDEDSTDASEGIVRLQNEQPRPLEEFGVDPEFSEVVSRAIARDQRDRWDSAEAFAEALTGLGRTSDGATGPESAAENSHPDAGDDASAPSVDDERVEAESDERSGELEPGGPSSVLVTLAVALLLASNVGWFFFYMERRGRESSDETRSQPVAAARTLQVDSRPEGAAVYAPGREEPIGRTPVEIPASILESGPVELQLKKTGYPDTKLELRRDSARQTITVQLPDRTRE